MKEKKKPIAKIKIEKAFLNLIKKYNINDISIKEICGEAKVNRSTFYSYYSDIYDLADKVINTIGNNINIMLNENSTKDDYLSLFRHIKENQLLYYAYFKLGYDSKFFISDDNIDYFKNTVFNHLQGYHIEFFRAGINRILRLWLEGDCKESEETLYEIIKNEYELRKIN